MAQIRTAREESQEDSSFPADGHQTILIKSTKFLWGVGGGGVLNRFYAATTIALGFAVVHKHTSYSVRVKDF